MREQAICKENTLIAGYPAKVIEERIEWKRWGSQMSKKIDDYKMKVKKLEKTVILIGVLILLLGVLISIAYYTVNRGKLN